jgi:hypothetical protein
MMGNPVTAAVTSLQLSSSHCLVHIGTSDTKAVVQALHTAVFKTKVKSAAVKTDDDIGPTPNNGIGLEEKKCNDTATADCVAFELYAPGKVGGCFIFHKTMKPPFQEMPTSLTCLQDNVKDKGVHNLAQLKHDDVSLKVEDNPDTSNRPDLTVINSLGPVLPNETVVSFAPDYAGAGVVTVELDVRGTDLSAAGPPVLRQAAGIVHWLNDDAELDQRNYTLCVDGTCGPPAKLNVVELWWHQCVGSSRSEAQPSNGLVCAASGVLRIFGKAIAFDGGRCTPYSPYIHGTTPAATAPASKPVRLRLTVNGAAPVELAATTQSCYDATFVLPASLHTGNYTMMVKGNLPSSTWELARDPDQHTLAIVAPTACDAAGKTIMATSAASLKKALAASRVRQGGATVVVEGTIMLTEKEGPLVLPQCTVLKGAGGNGGGKLQFSSASCAMKTVPLIGPDPLGCGSATVEDLEIEAVVLNGCTGLLGALSGSGFTLRRLNVTASSEMRKQNAYVGLVSMVKNTHFLIEDCTFLHLGNNTLPVPIFSTLMASEGIIRNNFWQVGMAGFHIDRSYHIIQESNVYSKSKTIARLPQNFFLILIILCAQLGISTMTRHARCPATSEVLPLCPTGRGLSLALADSSLPIQPKTSSTQSTRASH